MATRVEIIENYFRNLTTYNHIPYKPIAGAIIREVERMGPNGVFLSTACALVEQESTGRNIFGCDWKERWTNVPPYCNVEVTKERVQELIRNIENGGGQNGVGYCQLTSIGYVREAERLGGAHLAGPNIRVGLRVLNNHIANLGWPAGAAAYNAGAGNWQSVIDTYGESMRILEREWAERLGRASE